MRKWIVLLFAFALCRQARSDGFSSRLQNGRNAGRLTEAQTVYLEALRLIRPDMLPADLRPGTLPIKCASLLVNRVRNQWDRFSSDQQNVLSALWYRPNLPSSLVSPGGRFKIHYTTSGTSGISSEDLDHSGVPDYAEHAAAIMDSVYAVEVGLLDFKAPPVDDSDGPEWDVYLVNIPGSYGWTTPDKLLSRNPNLYTSYIELDNNYTSTPTRGLDGLRTTAAHEFFHMIVFGYNGRDDDQDGNFEDQFLMEASCTWMEDAVYPKINDYYNYLPEYFDNTNIPFDRMDGWREYGLSLWFHFLAKRYGGSEIVRSIWEETITSPALKANDRVLAKKGSSFRDELALYYAWNVMTGSRADTARYYPEGAAYPEINLDDYFSFNLDTTLSSNARYTASRYFQFASGDGSVFTLVATNTDWESKILDNRFTLALINDGNRPLYTSIDEKIAVRLLSSGNPAFHCVAVTENPGRAAVMTGFGVTRSAGEDNSNDCYPNPFVLKNHASVTIPFFLDRPGLIQISIYDPSGYRVRRAELYFPVGGEQSVHWNGRNDRGESVSGGIYVAVVSTDAGVISKAKLAVVR